MTCPVSWFRLERYVLGDLPEFPRSDVEEHLRTCEICRQRLGRIEADVRPMPRLSERPRRAPPSWSPPWWTVPALLAAMALWWVVPPSAVLPDGGTAIKGGDVALQLVRERAGMVTEGARSYAPGDRVRARVTCPPGGLDARLTVAEGDGPAVEIDRSTVRCGNAVAVGGAFRLTGTAPVTVCVIWDDGHEQVCRSLDGTSSGPSN